MLKGAHVVDPRVGIDDFADVLVEGGRIAKVAHLLDNTDDAEVIDLSGRIMVPGLVDMHVHLRDPGFEYKENIASGTRAALHGGFTAVACMANTNPAIDDATGIEYIRARADAVGACKVIPVGACTQGLAGEILSEMGDMRASGAAAFSDDGHGIQDTAMFRTVLEYASQFDVPVLLHCEDSALSRGGQVNEGIASTRLGLLGYPAAAEEIDISRAIALSKLTGCTIHIQHVSTKAGLVAVRRAKEDGVHLSCEATPHHMFLTEDDIDDTYPTNLKVNPPLRTAADAEALIHGVIDGSIDVIASDHAPHAAWEKDVEFDLAPFGMTGLETSLGLVLTYLVNPGLMGISRLVELMSHRPREILHQEPVCIRAGSVADLTVLDPKVSWVVDEQDFESLGGNSGFLGRRLQGRATDMIIDGELRMRNGEVLV